MIRGCITDLKNLFLQGTLIDTKDKATHIVHSAPTSTQDGKLN